MGKENMTKYISLAIGIILISSLVAGFYLLVLEPESYKNMWEIEMRNGSSEEIIALSEVANVTILGKVTSSPRYGDQGGGFGWVIVTDSLGNQIDTVYAEPLIFDGYDTTYDRVVVRCEYEVAETLITYDFVHGVGNFLKGTTYEPIP